MECADLTCMNQTCNHVMLFAINNFCGIVSAIAEACNTCPGLWQLSCPYLPFPCIFTFHCQACEGEQALSSLNVEVMWCRKLKSKTMQKWKECLCLWVGRAFCWIRSKTAPGLLRDDSSTTGCVRLWLLHNILINIYIVIIIQYYLT